MNKQLLLLASKMLELASNEFSNHGCNDLDNEILELITDGKKLCNDMREWNGDPNGEWPEETHWIGDYSLMDYLSYKLKEEAEKRSV